MKPIILAIALLPFWSYNPSSNEMEYWIADAGRYHTSLNSSWLSSPTPSRKRTEP
jgi:hypothetical protein